MLPQPLLRTGSDEAVVGDDGGCGGYLPIVSIPVYYEFILIRMIATALFAIIVVTVNSIMNN